MEKNPLLIHKKGGEEIVSTRVSLHQIYVQKCTIYTDQVWLHSTIFNRVNQHRSYEQKRSNTDNNSWLCSVVFNQDDSALLFFIIHASCSVLGTIQALHNTDNPKIGHPSILCTLCWVQSEDCAPNTHTHTHTLSACVSVHYCFLY